MLKFKRFLIKSRNCEFIVSYSNFPLSSYFESIGRYCTLITVFLFCLLTFQVELVLDMEETVPKKFANRAHVKKHVVYPNRDESKVF